MFYGRIAKGTVVFSGERTEMDEEIKESLERMDYRFDPRRPPDEPRRQQFHVGWADATDRNKTYTPSTLRRLTWRNLGYRLGRDLGAKSSKRIDDVFDALADLYEEDFLDKRGQKWSPSTPEDRILHEYWQRVGGRIYVEVPIGSPNGKGGWASDSKTRWIDGVRLPAGDKKSGIFFFTGNQPRFTDELKECGSADIIEVKASLNRNVIGQVLVGIDMFERQYEVTSRPIIVCGSSDYALEWVCCERSIQVAKVQ